MEAPRAQRHGRQPHRHDSRAQGANRSRSWHGCGLLRLSPGPGRPQSRRTARSAAVAVRQRSEGTEWEACVYIIPRPPGGRCSRSSGNGGGGGGGGGGSGKPCLHAPAPSRRCGGLGRLDALPLHSVSIQSYRKLQTCRQLHTAGVVSATNAALLRSPPISPSRPRVLSSCPPQRRR